MNITELAMYGSYLVLSLCFIFNGFLLAAANYINSDYGLVMRYGVKHYGNKMFNVKMLLLKHRVTIFVTLMLGVLVLSVINGHPLFGLVGLCCFVAGHLIFTKTSLKRFTVSYLPNRWRDVFDLIENRKVPASGDMHIFVTKSFGTYFTMLASEDGYHLAESFYKMLTLGRLHKHSVLILRDDGKYSALSCEDVISDFMVSVLLGKTDIIEIIRGDAIEEYITKVKEQELVKEEGRKKIADEKAKAEEEEEKLARTKRVEAVNKMHKTLTDMLSTNSQIKEAMGYSDIPTSVIDLTILTNTAKGLDVCLHNDGDSSSFVNDAIAVVMLSVYEDSDVKDLMDRCVSLLKCMSVHYGKKIAASNRSNNYNLSTIRAIVNAHGLSINLSDADHDSVYVETINERGVYEIQLCGITVCTSSSFVGDEVMLPVDTGERVECRVSALLDRYLLCLPQEFSSSVKLDPLVYNFQYEMLLNGNI